MKDKVRKWQMNYKLIGIVCHFQVADSTVTITVRNIIASCCLIPAW